MSTDPAQEELFNVTYKYHGSAVENGTFMIDLKMPDEGKVNISNIALTLNIKVHSKSENSFSEPFETAKITGWYDIVSMRVAYCRLVTDMLLIDSQFDLDLQRPKLLKFQKSFCKGDREI